MGDIERDSHDPAWSSETLPSRDAATTGARRSANPASPALALRERYEIDAELGRGGMGIVVAARDRALGRVVALKVLHESFKQEPTTLRRFTVEAQVGAQLEHPNIAPVYAMEQDGEAPAFTMRLLEGQSYHAYLAACRARRDEDHALSARLEPFLKVCDAVEYAHSEGVVHRDLKPANVVLGEHGEVYLVDWGVAKVLGAPEDPDLGMRATLPPDAPESAAGVSVSVAGETLHGDLVGTPTYMAPEQASGQVATHGPATDQFSLGMMLQELVTLAPPRTGKLLEQIFAAGRAEREPMVRAGDGGPAPAALVAIVERSTKLDPSARYPSVEHLADDVRRWMRGDEVSVRPDGWTRRLWRRLSRRPQLVLGVIGALIVLASIAVSVALGRLVVIQRDASAQSARLARTTGVVVRRSEAIDATFARTRALVEGLAVATESLLAHGAPHDGPLQYGVAGRLVGERAPPLEGLRAVDRYGDMPVTFEHGLYLYPPEVPHDRVDRSIRVLAPLNQRFRELLLRSGDDRAAAWPRARQDEALHGGEPPLHVTYLGLEDGLLLNYPGYEPFPDDYDPRRRPWYREARDRFGVHFGRPYPDASGSAILVPCNRTMRGPDGAPLGVVGADMALDDLAAQMRLDLPGWRHSSVVDAAGRTLVDTEQAGMRLGVGLHGDRALAARPVAAPIVAEITRDATGWMRHGDDLIVFDRLEEIGWTLVVFLDPGAR